MTQKVKQACVTWSSNVEVVRGVGTCVVKVGRFYGRFCVILIHVEDNFN